MFVQEPFKAIMALAGLFKQVERAGFAADRCKEAAGFLEERLMALSDAVATVQ